MTFKLVVKLTYLIHVNQCQVEKKYFFGKSIFSSEFDL